MTGPQPAGRPWTQAEEAQLRQLIVSKVKVGLIAKKLKRSPGAIYARVNSIKKKPVDLEFGEPAGTGYPVVMQPVQLTECWCTIRMANEPRELHRPSTISAP
jgi:hypothetical protein